MWFSTEAADCRSMINGRSEAQLKTRKGPKHQTREHADRSEVLVHEGDI